MTFLEPRVWSSLLGSRARVLVLAPHPDDETLGCGGLLARAAAHGAEVRVVFVTDGENNAWAQRAAEHRWHLGADNERRWGVRRRAEALAALAELGIDGAAARFLGFADQGLTRVLLGGATPLVDILAAELLAFSPTLVVAPDAGDLHPDHSALAVLLTLVRERLGWGLPFVRLAYTVHGRGATRGAMHLSLDPTERAMKRRAICAHRSQAAAVLRRIVAAPRYELFVLPDADDPHGLRAALWRGMLRLDVVLPRTRVPLRTPWVHVVAGGGCGAWSVELPARSGRAILHGGTKGTGRVAAARVRRGARRAKLALPVGSLVGARWLFVKVERRGIFFDAAGWRAVALERTPARLPAVSPPALEVVGGIGPA